MVENDNIRLVEDLFKQAAMQQVEDDGFTERVMLQVEAQTTVSLLRSRRLCRLWTWFCVLLGGVLFFLFDGWQLLMSTIRHFLHMLLVGIEVLVATAPTAEININPWTVLLLMAFVLVFLPYQTYRRLSASL